jgi:DNA-binding transcriptional LysR family regulator
LRVQLRSFDAVCRLVECNVGIGIVPMSTALRQAKTMAIRPAELSDEWAVRRLTICVRREAELPVYARELFHHLSGSAPVTATLPSPPLQAVEG